MHGGCRVFFVFVFYAFFPYGGKRFSGSEYVPSNWLSALPHIQRSKRDKLPPGMHLMTHEFGLLQYS
jgi:hypothetical protein